MTDIRWKQRFNNYLKAFQTLIEAVELAQTRELSNLEELGLIQRFKYTHELAWNVLKDYLKDEGFTDLIGSRDATRIAFKNGLIQDGNDWMDMITARNESLESYKPEIAQRIATDILERFYPALATMTNNFKAMA